jgi:hypothetical protein
MKQCRIAVQAITRKDRLLERSVTRKQPPGYETNAAGLEEASLHGAGAAEGDVSASHARIAVGEDLGVVGLEDLLGGVAVKAPNVNVVKLLVHGLKNEEGKERESKGKIVSTSPSINSWTPTKYIQL